MSRPPSDLEDALRGDLPILMEDDAALDLPVERDSRLDSGRGDDQIVLVDESSSILQPSDRLEVPVIFSAHEKGTSGPRSTG